LTIIIIESLMSADVGWCWCWIEKAASMASRGPWTTSDEFANSLAAFGRASIPLRAVVADQPRIPSARTTRGPTKALEKGWSKSTKGDASQQQQQQQQSSISLINAPRSRTSKPQRKAKVPLSVADARAAIAAAKASSSSTSRQSSRPQSARSSSKKENEAPIDDYGRGNNDNDATEAPSWTQATAPVWSTTKPNDQQTTNVVSKAAPTTTEILSKVKQSSGAPTSSSGGGGEGSRHGRSNEDFQFEEQMRPAGLPTPRDMRSPVLRPEVEAALDAGLIDTIHPTLSFQHHY
jgi:hypothetical protein